MFIHWSSCGNGRDVCWNRDSANKVYKFDSQRTELKTVRNVATHDVRTRYSCFGCNLVTKMSLILRLMLLIIVTVATSTQFRCNMLLLSVLCSRTNIQWWANEISYYSNSGDHTIWPCRCSSDTRLLCHLFRNSACWAVKEFACHLG